MADKNSTGGMSSWIRGILDDLKSDKITIQEAVDLLGVLPYEDLEWAKLDHHRSIRTGFPEVVFGKGKTIEQIVTVSTRILERSSKLLVTQVSEEAAAALKASITDAVYHPVPHLITINREVNEELTGRIAVVAAGTSDLPPAEEAAVTAELMGSRVERMVDVGVAGIHRVLDIIPEIRKCKAVIVVAGMEGALPSVVAGLVSVPVIAVPTSVGYGASFKGIAPLLTMLNSCAPGIAVVNIDNGFGAGYMAGLINLQSSRG